MCTAGNWAASATATGSFWASILTGLRMKFDNQARSRRCVTPRRSGPTRSPTPIVWQGAQSFVYRACPGWVLRCRPVLGDELLAEPLRQPLADEARDDVGRVAGRKADDQMHRPRRICLRPCEPRHARQGGSARDQTQKSTAGKFHAVLPIRRRLPWKIASVNSAPAWPIP